MMDRSNNQNDQDDDPERTKQERIKALLVRIGEKSKSPLLKNLELLSKALSKDLEEQLDFILDILFQCVVHLTSKTGIYGALVGLLNMQDENFGRKVVQRLIVDLESSIRSADFARIAVLIKFLGELSSARVVAQSDMLSFLNVILDTFGVNKVDQKLADFFFYCAAAILPNCGSLLMKRVPDEFSSLIRRTTAYFEKRKPDKTLKYYTPIRNENPEGFVQSFWAALMAESDNEWKTNVLVTPTNQFEDHFEKNDPHPFDFPDISDCKILGKFPEFCGLLEILPEEIEPNKKTKLDRLLLFEYYSDIILYFEDSLTECTRQLLYLTEINQSPKLLFETIFSLILQLPFSQSNLTFYGCVISECFKAQPKLYPKILARIVGSFFDKIDDMDIECRDRISSWFSFHLTNFGFSWAWAEWAFVASERKDAPKRLFVESVLRACAELRFGSECVPNKELQALLHDDRKPVFPFEKALDAAANALSALEDNAENSEKASIWQSDDPREEASLGFLALLLKKEGAESVASLVEKTVAAFGEKETLELLFSTMLFVGRERLSNLFRLFDKYKSLFVDMNLNEGMQTVLVESVFSFWAKSQLHQTIVLQKLVTYSFVTPSVLLGVILSEKHLSNFNQEFYMKILVNLIDLFSKRIKAMHKIIKKEFPDDAENNQNIAKKDILDKIQRAVEERQEIVFRTAERLSLASIHFVKSFDDYEQNTLFRAIFGRLVMFLRKYRQIAAEVSDKLEASVFNANPQTAPAEAFHAIVH